MTATASAHHAAIRVALRTMHAAADVPIGYTRDGLRLDIRGIKGRTKYEAETEDGTKTELWTEDWLVEAALLNPGTEDGRLWLPRPGDVIDWTDETGVTVYYPVFSPEKMPVFHFRDPMGFDLRIHCEAGSTRPPNEN